MENKYRIDSKAGSDNNINKVFAPSLFLLAGLVLGYIICARSLNIPQYPKYRIAYISQREIMDFENKRLASLRLKKDKITENQQLFCGLHKEAINLIESEAEALSKKSRDLKIIFSYDKVYGSEVFSISKQIYRKVIKTLKTKQRQQVADVSLEAKAATVTQALEDQEDKDQ